MADSSTTSLPVITADQLLMHWQGHRTLTRRVIDAFPEKDLFNYTIGGMRTFSQLAMEFIGMAAPTLIGITTRTWPEGGTTEAPATKADLLRLWDETTAEIDRLFPTIEPAAFRRPTRHSVSGRCQCTCSSIT
jgi:uncharacterized damage-inducible protein DinB